MTLSDNEKLIILHSYAVFIDFLEKKAFYFAQFDLNEQCVTFEYQIKVFIDYVGSSPKSLSSFVAVRCDKFPHTGQHSKKSICGFN